jgi:hypothetical protein
MPGAVTFVACDALRESDQCARFHTAPLIRMAARPRKALLMHRALVVASMGAALASSVSLAQQQAVASSGLNVRTGRSTSAAIVGQTATTNGDSVRISGWLMFDPLHYDQMWQYDSAADTTGTKARITLWEIHPITRIEVFKNGTWRSLDTP